MVMYGITTVKPIGTRDERAVLMPLCPVHRLTQHLLVRVSRRRSRTKYFVHITENLSFTTVRIIVWLPFISLTFRCQIAFTLDVGVWPTSAQDVPAAEPAVAEEHEALPMGFPDT